MTLFKGLVLAIALSAVTAHAGDDWMTDYEDARKESKKTGKPILANFTGSDWCGYCIRLDKEVFSTDTFEDWAEENVVLLEIDFPRRTSLSKKLQQQNNKLAQQFGIRGFPTILFLDKDGDKLGGTGYLSGKDAKGWTDNADGIIAAYLKSTKRVREKAAEPKPSASTGGVKADTPNPWAKAKEQRLERLKSEGYRDWTNTSGRTIFAKYLGKKEGKVALLMDGKGKVILDISSLSAADQALIASK